MLRGVELGVLHGSYARDVLQRWPSCIQYVLCDLWAPQENYVDLANVGQSEQDNRMLQAIQNTEPWKEKIVVCRNYTTECAKLFPDGHFSFAYLDARHDKLGVIEDLNAWWDKVEPDGLVCGYVRLQSAHDGKSHSATGTILSPRVRGQLRAGSGGTSTLTAQLTPREALFEQQLKAGRKGTNGSCRLHTRKIAGGHGACVGSIVQP